jgi:hypothetical protein
MSISLLDVQTGNTSVVGSVGGLLVPALFSDAGEFYAVSGHSEYRFDPVTAALTLVGSIDLPEGVILTDAASVPEPSTLVSATSGILILAIYAFFRRRRTVLPRKSLTSL